MDKRVKGRTQGALSSTQEKDRDWQFTKSSEKRRSDKSGTQGHFVVSSVFCWVKEEVTVYDNVSVLLFNFFFFKFNTLERCAFVCNR